VIVPQDAHFDLIADVVPVDGRENVVG